MIESSSRSGLQTRGPTAFSVGHSNHDLTTFLTLLASRGIALLVDVRSHPVSRRVPHFSKAPLAEALRRAGIDYRFLGQELGGRPDGAQYYSPEGQLDIAARHRAADFHAGIDRVIALLAEGRTFALMCSEEDPQRCHRRRLIAPALAARGIPLIHLRADGRVQDEADLAREDGQAGRTSPGQGALFDIPEAQRPA